jgi:hypothetical protein
MISNSRRLPCVSGPWEVDVRWRRSMVKRRRRQYRVKPGHGDLITASVPTGECHVAGAIEDLSACGLRLSFKGPDLPRCDLRSIVNVRLQSPYFEEPIAIPSVVTYRAQADEGVVYGFEFLDWLGLLHLMPEELKAVFNRRRDHRVVPDPSEPIAVTVRLAGSGFEATAPVQEISASGLSFVAGAEAEEALREADLVRVSLRLPAADQDLVFTGKVISRSLTREGIRHGIYLVEEATEDFERGVRALISYIARRRRETLGIPAAPAALTVSSGSWPNWRVR